MSKKNELINTILCAAMGSFDRNITTELKKLEAMCVKVVRI